MEKAEKLKQNKKREQKLFTKQKKDQKQHIPNIKLYYTQEAVHDRCQNVSIQLFPILSCHMSLEPRNKVIASDSPEDSE